MSTISEKLTQLNTIKGDIKTAINNKGGEVGNDFSTYATAINNLSTGSGETYENPEFYELRTQNGTNYDHLFRSYNGPDIDVSAWDTSKVTSAQYCFSYCAKYMDISNWDLSSLTDASYMFDHFDNGNKNIDLSVLDFSNVTNASYMFSYANIDYLDVRNINLTGEDNYYYLFYNAKGKELDLSSWNTSNVTSLIGTFSGAEVRKIDITGWDTSKVTILNYTFSSSYLETLIMPDFVISSSTSVYSIFNSYSDTKLKYIDLSRSNDLTIKKIASSLPKKTATTYGKIVIPANTSQDVIDALIAKYWKPIGVYFDLNSTELVLELDEIKPDKTTKVYTGNSDPWYGDDRLEIIEFISSDESIATVNGREIRGITEGTVTIECRRREDNLLLGSTTLTVSETDSKPNLIKFRIDSSTLSNYYSAITVNGYGKYPTDLTKDPITDTYSYDPNEQITRISFGYDYSHNNLSELIKFNFNAANITNVERMFLHYRDTTLDLSDWDTSKVTNFQSFANSSLNLVEVKGELDLSNATNFDIAFGNCPNLETLYLKNIYKNTDLNNVNLYNMSIYLPQKVKDECTLYIINELPDLYAKGLTSNNPLKIELPLTNTLTAEQVQPAIDKGWTVVNVNF